MNRICREVIAEVETPSMEFILFQAPEVIKCDGSYFYYVFISVQQGQMPLAAVKAAVTFVLSYLCTLCLIKWHH